MLVYTDNISNRLQYTANFIAKESGIEKIELTQDRNSFNSFSGPKINYSSKKIAETEFWLQPHSLLFESNIEEKVIQCFDFNGSKAFFKTEGDFQFDLFAATFYLLSRYEEYLPHSKDIYGRYAHENSIAFNEGFLNVPVINQWLILFVKSLKQKFPAFSLKEKVFKFLPTYDIDEAFAFKNKGLLRNAGAAVKDLVKGKVRNIATRVKVLSNKKEDPYDTFLRMDEFHQQFNLQPIYFFLLAATTGKYDKNISPKKKNLQSILQHHSKNYSIGIHPSWQSGDYSSLLKKEIETLETFTNKAVTISRQHYIRFTLPVTFRLLIEAGIKEDYSMGYGSINGFRASVASSFYWYDLEKDESTNLLLHPFCYMEANSFYEQKMSATEALEEMLHYLNEVKKVNGILITLWHNTFLGTDPMFKGWKEAYQQFIKEAIR